MPTVVVPFRRAEGKRRLAGLPREARVELARAMLADVLAACEAIGPVVIADRDGGQGPAVQAALAAAVDAGDPPPYLVVNADLPCATADDLAALAAAVQDGGLALVAAADGTTNALALADAGLFAPLYGPGSAARFAALAPPATRLELPNLIDDVDTVADLEPLRSRVGPHTSRVLASLLTGAAA